MTAVICTFGVFFSWGCFEVLLEVTDFSVFSTLCFGEHNSYRTNVQRHPRSFYVLPSLFHLQQVYLAEQSELQVPWGHERRQRQQLTFKLISFPWDFVG